MNLFGKKPATGKPTPTDAAQRVLVLRHVVLAAMTRPPRAVLEAKLYETSGPERERFQEKIIEAHSLLRTNLEKTGLWEHTSPWEQKLFKANPLYLTEKQQVDASWRMESITVLMWALNQLEAIPHYDESSGKECLDQLNTVEPVEFIDSAQLRPAKDLERARAIAELWHWRSRTRQLIERGETFRPTPKNQAEGLQTFDDIIRKTANFAAADGGLPGMIDEDFPVHGKAYRDLTPQEFRRITSITAERHFSLNWLCGKAPDNQWDRTPTDT